MVLTQGELISVKERFIDALFTDEVPSVPLQPLSKTELFQKIMVGGYPLVQSLYRTSIVLACCLGGKNGRAYYSYGWYA
jgi:hypothetical protein